MPSEGRRIVGRHTLYTRLITKGAGCGDALYPRDRKSYSMQGEDKLLSNLLVGLASPVYVGVGANHSVYKGPQFTQMRAPLDDGVDN